MASYNELRRLARMAERVTCKLDHNDPEGIPDFLCRICNPLIRQYEADAERATAECQELPVRATADPIQARQAELRAAQAAARDAKRKASLAKHLDRHKFEKWDPKSKSWVRDEAKIDAHHHEMVPKSNTLVDNP